jgi:hypothetical protein
LIVVFLKPMKAPSMTLGTDNTQYMKRRTNIVGNGTAADDFSNQLTKLMIKNIVKTNEGYTNETINVSKSQSLP